MPAQRLSRLRERIARPGQLNRHDCLDPPWASGEHDDAIRQRDGLVDMVCHEQHRGARSLPHVQQKTLHPRPRLHVERREGFIHQQHLRLHRQRPGHGDALAHAARKLVWALVGRLKQADALKRLTGPAPAFLGGEAGDGEAEGDVVRDRQPGKQRGFLEDQAALGRWLRDAVTEGPDLAGCRILQSRDQIEQGGLAAAEGAEQNDELLGRNIEVDAAQRLVRARRIGRPGLADLAAHHRVAGGKRRDALRDHAEPPRPGESSKAACAAPVASRSRKGIRGRRSGRW